MNQPKRSNIYKVRHTIAWTMRDVIEHFSGKSYEEVVAEHKRKDTQHDKK